MNIAKIMEILMALFGKKKEEVNHYKKYKAKLFYSKRIKRKKLNK